MKTVGIADTTFSRSKMGSIAAQTLRGLDERIQVVQTTVPGIKDLPVAAVRLFREKKAELVMALGMPGKADYDRTCADEASHGLIQAGVQEGRPILEVFVFEAEARDDRELEFLARRRTEEHALNAYHLLFHPERLRAKAGTGQRQGFADAGPVGTPHKTRRKNNAIARYA